MNRPLIKPAVLKGFRDYLPDQMIARERLIDVARSVYRSFGFSPIDTPALEYAEILLGKGGDETDRQLFRFCDQGGRDVAMRFDLTVPLARFAAQHLNEIGIPFKRYHIGTVWRAEKPQKGRYREFAQCDFDTIGTESNVADIETLMVIHELMHQIGFSRFTIRVNHRSVLNGLLETLGMTGQTTGVLRALDKLPKIGRDAVIEEMTQTLGGSAERAHKVLDMAALSGRPEQILQQLESMLKGNEQGMYGIACLAELFAACRAAGLSSNRVVLDVAIARGLDYYTGTIYETFLGDLPGIGSVCSGGRYDHLAELFTSQQLPGVGASLGLDRLLAAMEELGMVSAHASTAQVLVTVLDRARLGDYCRVAQLLRTSGIAAEVFCDDRPIGKQLKYADRKGHSIALIAGEDEFAAGTWQVKNLRTKQQQSSREPELAATVQQLLGSG